jgi:predicted nucleotidyltransferase
MSTDAITPPAQLIADIARQCERSVATETGLLADSMKTRFGPALDAVILYGSCLRTEHFTEGVVDLYVVVSSYREAYTQAPLRYLNSWLPPNVFYLELDTAGEKIRAKYAVISASDLERGCSRWFHSYIWSRFAQPTRLLFARDRVMRDRIYVWFAQAVVRFLRTTVPVLGNGNFDSSALWSNGLSLTYAAELRPERHTRASQITTQNIADFSRLTNSSVPALSDVLRQGPGGKYQCLATSTIRKQTIRRWQIRRWQGLLLSVLRLGKAVYTFRDCVDYAAWKIQRHTGITIEVTPALRRHPILFGFSVLWQLIKRDGLH